MDKHDMTIDEAIIKAFENSIFNVGNQNILVNVAGFLTKTMTDNKVEQA